MSSGGDGTQYTEEELAEMSQDELVTAGLRSDDVKLAYRHERWPVKGTRAEKRAERSVALWFTLSGVSALAFFGVYVFWPWEYAPMGSDRNLLYTFYTPLLGLTMGLAILGLGVGVIAFAKKFIPDELAVQQRHMGGSSEFDKKTTVALLTDTGQRMGIGRRSLIKRSLGFGLGALGLMAIMPLGGLVKNPWKGGADAALWTTGWTPHNNEPIFLRRSTGRPDDISLVRPEDMAAGAMETVYPFRESERGNEEALSEALRSSDSPVMLIRLRPEDGAKVVKRAGQENYNYGDFYAYSKICTHAGCPTSLYEQQSNRILCPCHQSQFDVMEYAKPIFGPAARALPQLPITVNEQGFFVANGNFPEAVGPAFWERKS